MLLLYRHLELCTGSKVLIFILELHLDQIFPQIFCFYMKNKNYKKWHIFGNLWREAWNYGAFKFYITHFVVVWPYPLSCQFFAPPVVTPNQNYVTPSNAFLPPFFTIFTLYQFVKTGEIITRKNVSQLEFKVLYITFSLTPLPLVTPCRAWLYSPSPLP